MEEQMCKERAEATKASEHQLQAIMLELRAFKEKHEKDTKERKFEEKTLLENIKASIDPVLKRDHKTSDQIGIGARLKHLQEEVTNYLPPTVNKKRGAAVTNDDTFGDLTLGGYRDTKHVHFASTPIRPEISNINLTPPRTQKEESIAESVLHNTMQTLASEFKRTHEPKIQKFRGGTSSGALLVFKSWMQDIECAIKDRNLNNEEALQLVKEFSEGCARDNINFYLEVTDSPTVDGLFENLRQVFSSGEDGQQMLAEFYSCVQNQKESVKEFGESLLQINAVQSSKSAGFAPKQFRPSQFYGKPREPQLVPGTDGSLKPDIDCNYCKDLGHLKYNCPKLKEKEARMAGHRDYNKSKKEN